MPSGSTSMRILKLPANLKDICVELMRANVDDPAESDSDNEGRDESDDVFHQIKKS